MATKNKELYEEKKKCVSRKKEIMKGTSREKKATKFIVTFQVKCVKWNFKHSNATKKKGNVPLGVLCLLFRLMVFTVFLLSF